MDDKILKWLYDVKLAIDEIDSFFEGQDRNLFKYKNSLMLKRAVERNLEIIGEAITRIKNSNPEFLDNISEARSIIGLRNHVIHSYDNISDESIWSILTNHLPKLKQEVNQLIEKS